MAKSYWSVKAINNSSLSYINPEEGGSPEKYRKFLEEGFDKGSTTALSFGDVLHEHILEKKDFLLLDKMPSENIKSILDPILESIKILNDPFNPVSRDIKDYSERIVTNARSLNYGASWTEGRVVNDVIRKGEQYWNEILKNEDKIVTSKENFLLVTKIKENLELRPKVKNLLFEQTEEREQIFFEKEIYWKEDVTGLNFECKSKLDNLHLYHKSKTFSIRDLKSTRSLKNFPESFVKYHYPRQIAFYEAAVMFRLQEMGLKGYQPADHYIIAVEKEGSNSARAFKVSRKYVEEGKAEYVSLLNRIANHTVENNWLYSKEEIENDFIFLLEPEEIVN